jgi:N-acetylglutamate synthase-like GNAT family acetyltransferase
MSRTRERAVLIIRTVEGNEFEKIVAFYREADYTSELAPSDQFLIAEEGGSIKAALRLCRENGCLVLRGARVLPPYQRQGISTRLLRYAEKTIGERVCYCIPYAHLESFYAQIGFERIEPDQAPAFLKERLFRYREELSLDIILMRRTTLRVDDALEH